MARIAVAMSGGGHRAALFGLGTLLYLADSGKNAEVTSISSVSGGSLANAYVAQGVDFRKATAREFEEAVAPFARQIAQRGTFFAWPGTWVYLAALVLALAGAVALWWLAWPWALRLVAFVAAFLVVAELARQRGNVCFGPSPRPCSLLGASRASSATSSPGSITCSAPPSSTAESTPAAKAIAAAQGNVDLLRGEMLKVSHHGSKHGVNLELVERVGPKVSLISSVGGGGNYHFPHTVAQDLIREGLDPSTSDGDGHGHPADYEKEMNVFYTCDEDDQGAVLGSVALVMSDDECTMWRFGDRPTKQIDLGTARRWTSDVY